MKSNKRLKKTTKEQEIEIPNGLLLGGFAVIIAVILGTMIYFIVNSEKDLYPRENVFSAWNCEFEEDELCFMDNRIPKILDCEGPNGEIREEYCDRTSEGLNKVTVFTDNANHITSPLTQEEYNVEAIHIGNNLAWDGEFRDGILYYTEMHGDIVVHNLEEEIQRYTINHTQRFGNTGLLSLALDPEFEQNNYIYVYYYVGQREVEVDFTQTEPVYNRVSRFTMENGELVDELILIDNIEGSKGHSGGRIDIQDNYLYITTGDGEALKEEKDFPEFDQQIQSIDFLGGKVLRTYLNGSIPNDNPYENSYVYASGLRNPQGLDFHPETKEPYVSMHGPWRHDEINVIKSGGNYGWPAKNCDITYKEDVEIEQGELMGPIYCFNEWTIAPSGMTFVDDLNHPWYGDLFITGLRGSLLYRMDIDPQTYEVRESEVFYIKKYEEVKDVNNRLRDVIFYNGSLYLLGDGHGAAKITPNQE